MAAGPFPTKQTSTLDVADASRRPAPKTLFFVHMNRWKAWFHRLLAKWFIKNNVHTQPSPNVGVAEEARELASLSSPGESTPADASSPDDALLRSTMEPHFDSGFYLGIYRDVRESGVNALDHYLRYGWREGRKPREDFDTAFYLAQNEDVRQSGINPFYHYLVSGQAQGRSAERGRDDFERRTIAAHFDPDYYLKTYDDVRRAGVDPLDHFILMGWREKRNPTGDFDTAFYLSTNADVRSADINPLYHYVVAGKAEGRAPKHQSGDIDPAQAEAALNYARQVVEPHFDVEFYLEQNQDVRAAGIDPLLHYLTAGWREGRNPSWRFDTNFYLDSYEDVRRAGVNPYFHYIVAGQQEGRRAKDELSIEIDVLRNCVGSRERALRWIQPDAQAGNAESDLSSLVKRKLLRKAIGNCLSVSHDNYQQVTGGIQACLVDEQRLFKRLGYNYFHIFPAQPLPKLSEERDATKILVGLTVNGNLLGSVPAATVAVVLAPVFARTRRLNASRSEFPRRLLVLHSLLGHSTEALLSVAKALRIEHSYFWLHDYFSLCESYTLLRNDLAFCAAPKNSSQACFVCSHGASRFVHQQRIAGLFSKLRPTLVAPSRAALTTWGDNPLRRHISGRVVLPHCELIPAAQKHRGRSKRGLPEADHPLRVGFLGYDAYHKGWSVFERLAAAFSTDSRYQFYHLGNRQVRNPLVNFARVSAQSHDRDAMIRAVREHSVELVLIWPKWPETFSFVTLEAIAGGAFVITNSTSGNVAKLVRQYAAGCVLENERALEELFMSGEVAHLFREYRNGGTEWAGRLKYSGCSASLIATRVPLGMHQTATGSGRSRRNRPARPLSQTQPAPRQ